MKFDSARRRPSAQGDGESKRERYERERKSDDDVLGGSHFFDKTILHGHTHVNELYA